ncbi:hypothetical protein FACS1894188_04230 [Clostridia bacterium]|nr:hypothetical protein FACS1894188_04230 [Clostridia bacterium]
MDRKLYLSNTNKMIAGVCGGIAEYFKADATLVRIIMVLVMLLSTVFPVVIIYLVCWAIMPHPPEDKEYPLQ